MAEHVANGKWILAGEHAVLRGAEALVFPFRGGEMRLQFQTSNTALKVELSGTRGAELEPIAWGVIERALGRLGKSLDQVLGTLSLSSTLPIGAGLGASAALCVVIGRWCIDQEWLKASDLYEFSRALENIFHGESSGVDIAVAIENRGLAFVRGQKPRFLDLRWRPQLYLSYCGSRGVTSDCVSRVKALIERDFRLGAELDQRMTEASRLCKMALCELDEVQGEAVLIQGIELAQSCFREWGLADGRMGLHLKQLKEAGAIAVKPTGSGGGGYALSLWKTQPPAGLDLVAAL